MQLLPLLFSFDGRISRFPFWMCVLACVIIGVLAAMFFGSHSQAMHRFTDIMAIVLLWPGLAVQAKRWHDRDKSAWWILINLVPLIGQLWALIENGFLRGTEGKNRFGDDPMA